MFFVGGSSGAFLTSKDGSTWIDQSIGYSNYIGSAKTGNGLILMGGFDQLLLSSNELSWQQVGIPASDYAGALGFGDGRFVYLGLAGSIASSTNPTNWKVHRTEDGTEHFQGFCYGGGAYVALSSLGTYKR